MNTSLPVQPSQRVALLDVLRGFALFGVLLVNLHAVVFYTTPQEVLAGVSWPMDSVLDRLHHWLFESKFVTLFAMLFGYGFGLLLERLGTKGTAVAGFFFRRMGILFALGLLNLCLWWADILHVYALAGLALLLFRRASNGVVLTSAVVFGFGFTWAHFAFSKYVPHGFDPRWRRRTTRRSFPPTSAQWPKRTTGSNAFSKQRALWCTCTATPSAASCSGTGCSARTCSAA
ncbi:MAG: hypothetical protein IPI41_18890 [Flavobacteriales bacterium]|nr:hypothetical protein [Flavobacteriales bacterium]